MFETDSSNPYQGFIANHGESDLVALPKLTAAQTASLKLERDKPIADMTYTVGGLPRWPPLDFDKIQVGWHAQALIVRESISVGGGMETSTVVPMPHHGSLGIYSGAISRESLPLDSSVVHTCFRLLAPGKKQARYVTTYHNRGENVPMESNNLLVNKLAFINYWIWGRDEEINRNVNVVLRAGTGEMIIEASNRKILPAGILYLRPPTDHDWGPYHLILLKRLVADLYVLVVSYQQDFKDRCIDKP
jgi:hypothetical protein